MNYPQWKKLAWRYLRVFLATFLTLLAVKLGQKDFRLDQALIISMGSGALSAVVKALRDDISNGDVRARINKLPL